MPKGVPNKRYTPEYKKMVVEAVRDNHMSYAEAEALYEVAHGRIQQWERIYLMEGPEGLAVERRGRGSKGRPDFSRLHEPSIWEASQTFHLAPE